MKIATMFFLVCGVQLGLCLTQAIAAEQVSASTVDNTVRAYQEETATRRQFLAFAKKADEEGCGEVASLFRALAKAEAVHAGRFLKSAKRLGRAVQPGSSAQFAIGTTRENLDRAVDEERIRCNVTYPQWARQAKSENIMGPVAEFSSAAVAEASHAENLRRAQKSFQLQSGKNREFYVCGACGYLTLQIPAKKCPGCGASAFRFETVR